MLYVHMFFSLLFLFLSLVMVACPSSQVLYLLGSLVVRFGLVSENMVVL